MQTLGVVGGKSLINSSEQQDEENERKAGRPEASKAANASWRRRWLTHALSSTLPVWMRAGSLLGSLRLAVGHVEAAQSGRRNVIANRMA